MADDGGVKKVKVKFLRDEIYETEGRNQGKQFTSGRVYSMTEDQAGRWLRREAAELVEDTATAEEEGPPKPRRGRPPKVRTQEGGGVDDDADEEEDEDDAAPTEPLRQPVPNPVKPEVPARGPGPSHVTTPVKAPDKVR
jgi:hypothetical protein